MNAWEPKRFNALGQATFLGIVNAATMLAEQGPGVGLPGGTGAVGAGLALRFDARDTWRHSPEAGFGTKGCW
jgi:hypothetical protein